MMFDITYIHCLLIPSLIILKIFLIKHIILHHYNTNMSMFDNYTIEILSNTDTYHVRRLI